MTATAAPRPRSPAQIEASRRNGARSKGPVTPEGKRRSSANALKHGLDALHHLVLADEDPHELEGLTGRFLAELGPESELEARLVRRLAVAFWKGERAERMEVALLDGAPCVKPPTRGGTWEEAAAAETFDVRRLNAIRGHQAAQGREIARCLKELRQLRREPLLAEAEDEPEAASRNEPGGPAPASAPAANDDGPRHGMAHCAAVVDQASQNEPGEPVEPDAATLAAGQQAVREWAEARRRRAEAERAYAVPAEPAAIGPPWSSEGPLPGSARSR
jgi:hypothetical protein